MDAKKAILEASMGRIEIELWPDKAPNHVANLKKLADSKFYDGLIFHRVIPNFMIQTGCPHGRGTHGPGWNIDAEFNDAAFDKGVVGMARSQDPNSAGSQFFICVDDAHWLNGEYTAFGKVVAGQDVADAISRVARDGSDRPHDEVTITSLVVE